MTTEIDQTIGFLGAGRMATALASGFLAGEGLTADRLVASDVSAAARTAFAQSTGATAIDSNAEVVRRSDVVFLAVKPQQLSIVLSDLDEVVTDSHLIVSIVAGASLKTLEAGFKPATRVIRVMPNTPALVGCGASAYTLGLSATAADGQLVERLLSTVGMTVSVAESLLDAVTGLSGSGPAFIFLAIEALSDGGVRMGLPRKAATMLAAQTVLGAAKMVLETGRHPAELKDAVASPGGTTIAGLHALEVGGFRAALMEAVEAAALRSAELAQLS